MSPIDSLIDNGFQKFLESGAGWVWRNVPRIEEALKEAFVSGVNLSKSSPVPLSDSELLREVESQGWILCPYVIDEESSVWVVKEVVSENTFKEKGRGLTVRSAIFDALLGEDDPRKFTYIPPEYR